MNNIGIIGGTSPLGISIIDFVNNNFNDFYTITSSYRKNKYIPEKLQKNQNNIKWIKVDFCNNYWDINAFKRCNILIWVTHIPNTKLNKNKIDLNIDVLKKFCNEVVNPLQKIIFISSGGSVYGNVLKVPISENNKLEPISEYGKSKKMMENYLVSLKRRINFKLVILRPSNIYGFSETNRAKGIIPKYFKSVIHNEIFYIIGDGLNIRDYIYISDVIKAIIECIKNEIENEIFNIGSGIGLSTNDLVELMQNIIYKNPKKIVRKSSKLKQVNKNILNNSKIKSKISWKPIVDISSGLLKTYRLYKITSKKH